MNFRLCHTICPLHHLNTLAACLPPDCPMAWATLAPSEIKPHLEVLSSCLRIIYFFYYSFLKRDALSLVNAVLSAA